MPFNDSRTLTPIDGKKPDDIALFAARVASLIDNPIADVKITPETDTTSPRTVTIQVRDRHGDVWKGRWWVRVMVGDAEYGSLGTHTVALVTGEQMLNLAPDRVVDILTTSDGSASFSIAASAGTRYVTASIIGRAQSSGTVSIT